MRDRLCFVLCLGLLGTTACDSSSDAEPAQDASMPDDGDAGDEPITDAGTDADTESDAGQAYSSPVYELDDNWLCNPEASTDRCGTALTVTEIHPDNSLTEVEAEAPTQELDCFYVYPTVALAQDVVGQVEDFSNIEDIWESAGRQVGPFSSVCRVFAPLYHQITIGSYLDPSAEMLLDEAYEEIADAFDHYLAQYNDGRDFVLIGHSQGSHLLRRLVQRKIDQDAALREQMALAILLGPLGDITVPTGEVVGGSFENVPVCQSADERSCLISYSSYPADMPPAAVGLFFGGVPEGMDTPCTNPAALAGGKAPATGTYMPTVPAAVTAGTLINLQEELSVPTDLALYRDFYSLECTPNEQGISYLAVSVDAAADDERVDPILYDAEALFVSLVGLHIFDFGLAEEDLVQLVGAHAR